MQWIAWVKTPQFVIMVDPMSRSIVSYIEVKDLKVWMSKGLVLQNDAILPFSPFLFIKYVNDFFDYPPIIFCIVALVGRKSAIQGMI